MAERSRGDREDLDPLAAEMMRIMDEDESSGEVGGHAAASQEPDAQAPPPRPLTPDEEAVSICLGDLTEMEKRWLLANLAESQVFEILHCPADFSLVGLAPDSTLSPARPRDPGPSLSRLTAEAVTFQVVTLRRISRDLLAVTTFFLAETTQVRGRTPEVAHLSVCDLPDMFPSDLGTIIDQLGFWPLLQALYMVSDTRVSAFVTLYERLIGEAIDDKEDLLANLHISKTVFSETETRRADEVSDFMRSATRSYSTLWGGMQVDRQLPVGEGYTLHEA